METALRETQTQFYALDMQHVGEDFKVDDGFNILKLRVKDAEADHALNFIASTYDPYGQVIRDGLYDGGRKIISFAGVLQQDVFPLPQLLQMTMRYGAAEMRRPIEVEFACNLNADRTGSFFLLQIRPIVDSKQMLDEDICAISDDRCLLRSHNSLGHGASEEVTDVVYVKTDDQFTAINNPAIACEIERINRRFLDEGRGERCSIGPGRWGSSDPWLGVPVKVASHQRRSGHRRGRTQELPGGPQPGHTLLPEPHQLWRGLLHHRHQHRQRHLPQGGARRDARGRRDSICKAREI